MKNSRFVLCVLMIIGLISFFSIDAVGAAYPPIQLQVPYYPQKKSGDCGISSISMIEAYSLGLGVTDFDTVYAAVYSANKNSFSISSACSGGKYDDISMTLESYYEQLSKGKPILIRREPYEHWSVIVGYQGSSTKLEESGFIVWDTKLGVSKCEYDEVTTGRKFNLARWLKAPNWDSDKKAYVDRGNTSIVRARVRNSGAYNPSQGGASNTDGERVFNSGVTNITDTSARINAKVNPGGNCSEVGYYLGTSTGNMKKTVENLGGAYTESVWYNLGKGGNYGGDPLTPGTKYYYQIYAIIDGVTYKSTVDSFTTTGVNDSEPPVVSNVTISDVTNDGFTVSCTVTDNKGILQVNFPTWTDANGQDDLASEWPTPTSVNGNVYSYKVKISEHNNEYGHYIVHIYAYDLSGNHSIGATSINLVKNVPLKGFTLNKSDMTLKVNQSSTLSVTSYNPSDTTSDKTATWSSSDSSVATVNASGKVVGKKAGTAKITCQIAGIKKTCTVTVYEGAKITSQPIGVSVLEGENANFAVTATGTGLTYQWYYKLAGDSTFKQWTGKTKSYMSCAANAGFDGMQVYCVVEDSYGNSVSSNVATMSVTPLVMIVNQPKNVSVLEGDTINFALTAKGTNITYQWYYKKAGDASFAAWPGKTKSYMSCAGSLGFDQMQVYCAVTGNSGKTVNSQVVSVSVAPALAITQQPSDASVQEGNAINFSLKAVGTDLTYQWYYKKAGENSFNVWPGKTKSYMSCAGSLGFDGMQVYCAVTGNSGKTVNSQVVSVSVSPSLVITQQPSSVSVQEGDTVNFALKAVGTDLTYQWYYKKAGETSFSVWPGKIKSYMSCAGSLGFDGMQVYCAVTDNSGKTVNSQVVSVSVAPALAIIQQPSNVSVQEGNTVNFAVKAVGTDLTYQWYYKKLGDESFSAWPGKTKSYMSCAGNVGFNEMQVYCMVTDGSGNNAQTAIVTLKVTPSLAITKQPTSLTVQEGEEANFSMVTVGSNVSYQWYYKRADMNEFTLWPGKTKSYMSCVGNVGFDQMQVYCVASNSQGDSVTSAIVTLTVQ